MALRLPRLQRETALVEDTKRPTLVFMRWWDSVAAQVEIAINGIQDALTAAGIAQTAAENAQTAADAAAAAASAAQASATSGNEVASLTNSGVTGLTLTATDAGSDATVSISAHTRVYGDGTTVSVNSGTLTGLSYSETYYIYYDDPTRAGGAVTYLSSTSEADGIQAGDTHLVGLVTTPAALDPDTDGIRVRPPGVGGLEDV